MKRNWLAVGIILLCLGTSIIPAIAQNTEKPFSASRANCLYVGGSGPGNYTRIQDAVDNASNGDTVFVYDDLSPYYENLIINKSIFLIGEDKNTTIIDGNQMDQGIIITTDEVTIQDFTIQNCHRDGIDLQNCNNSTVSSNIVNSNRVYGILSFGCNNNISYNSFLNNGRGISVSASVVYRNYFSNNEEGIFCRESNGIIKSNRIENNQIGINFYSGSSNYNIINNSISNNNCGIYLYMSYSNLVSFNHIIDNKDGVLAYIGGNHKNYILNNYFINNSEYGLKLTAGSIVCDNEFLMNGILMDTNMGFHTIENNRVNGKPLVYLFKETGKVIQDAGQIILDECSSITIKNINFTSSTVGITFIDTHNCIVTDSIFSTNKYGIMLMDSSTNDISSSTFSENNLSILIQDSNDITISHSDFVKNGLGMKIDFSGNSKYTRNNFIDNDKDIEFRVDYKQIHNSIWTFNYFKNSVLNFIKILPGRVRTRFSLPSAEGPSYFYRNGFYFDFFPSRFPIVIDTGQKPSVMGV